MSRSVLRVSICSARRGYFCLVVSSFRCCARTRRRSQRPRQVRRLPRSLSQHPRRIFGWNPDLTVRRSLSASRGAPPCSPLHAPLRMAGRASRYAYHSDNNPMAAAATGMAGSVCRSGLACRLSHSIASRTTAHLLCPVGRLGFEARAPQVAFRLESVIWERRNAAGDYRESVCRRRRCECRLRPASDG